jgi:hypothetical protein
LRRAHHDRAWYDLSCRNTVASKQKAACSFSRLFSPTGQAISLSKKSIVCDEHIAPFKTAVHSKRLRSAFCRTHSRGLGAAGARRRFFDALEPHQEWLFPRSRCKVEIAEPSHEKRKGNLAASVLGACNSRRCRSRTSCRLCPFQSREARSCCACVGLAAQQLSSLRRTRVTRTWLGRRLEGYDWIIRGVNGGHGARAPLPTLIWGLLSQAS